MSFPGKYFYVPSVLAQTRKYTLVVMLFTQLLEKKKQQRKIWLS